MSSELEFSKAIDGMLTLLPILSAPDFKACEWQGGKLPNGSMTMPYPEYHPVVDQLFKTYSAIWIHPYELLPEDPAGFDPQKFSFSADYFQSSTLDQTRRYFSLISRRERFCDGYIAEEVETGVIAAAIRRLGALCSPRS